jgi:hypothetical protein
MPPERQDEEDTIRSSSDTVRIEHYETVHPRKPIHRLWEHNNADERHAEPTAIRLVRRLAAGRTVQ